MMTSSLLKIIYGGVAGIGTIFGLLIIFLLLDEVHANWQINLIALVVYLILVIELLIRGKERLSLTSFFIPILFCLVLFSFLLQETMYLPSQYEAPYQHNYLPAGTI